MLKAPLKSIALTAALLTCSAAVVMAADQLRQRPTAAPSAVLPAGVEGSFRRA